MFICLIVLMGNYVTNEEAEEANRKAQEIIDLETL